MKKLDNRFLKVISSLSLLFVSTIASAQLYVSDTKLKNAEYKQAKEIRKKSKGVVLSGSSHDGQYVISEYEPESTTVLRFGQNVPIMVALDKLVPAEIYSVNYDEELESVLVSWRGGETWIETVTAISEQNDIDLFVNHQERVIGVSKDTQVAMHLASAKPQVWRLRPELTLKENIEAWSKSAGWSVAWGVDFDFPVDHKATIFGAFDGKNGPVDQVLQSYQSQSTPLTAHYYKNKVVRITEAGFRQEVSY